MKGECDPAWGILSEEKLIKIGSLRIGLTHGHQHLPWGDLTSLKGLQRNLVLLFHFAQNRQKRYQTLTQNRYHLESTVGSRIPTVKLKIPGFFLNPNPELLLHSSYSF